MRGGRLGEEKPIPHPHLHPRHMLVIMRVDACTRVRVRVLCARSTRACMRMYMHAAGCIACICMAGAFRNVAELSLLCAKGCGGQLLRAAVQHLRDKTEFDFLGWNCTSIEGGGAGGHRSFFAFFLLFRKAAALFGATVFISAVFPG